MPVSAGAEDMQPSLPPVVLALLLVTLATSAPLVVLLRTLELLRGENSKQEEEEENISQNWGYQCLQHCLALGHLHPAQCHELC